MYIKKDGKVLWFLNSKAEKNFKLRRKPRNVTWTGEARAAKTVVKTAAQKDDKGDDKKAPTPTKKAEGKPSRTSKKKGDKK